MLVFPPLLKAIYAMCSRFRMNTQVSLLSISFVLYHQCGHLRKAVKYEQPGHINSRQICYQQTGGMHAQCEKDNMPFINPLFSYKRFIIFAKALVNINSLCLWAIVDGPRPDSSKCSGPQLLFFSSWLSCSQIWAKWSAGSQLAAFVMLQGEWKRGQGCKFSLLMRRFIPQRENNVPRLKSPAPILTTQVSDVQDVSPGLTYQRMWQLSPSQSPRRQLH